MVDGPVTEDTWYLLTGTQHLDVCLMPVVAKPVSVTLCLLQSAISRRNECYLASVQKLKVYNLQYVLWRVGIKLYLQMVVLIVISQYSLGFGLTIPSLVVLMICNSSCGRSDMRIFTGCDLQHDTKCILLW